MGKTSKPSPNDQRSVVKNPNNEAFKADKINTEIQLATPPPPPPKTK